MTPATINIVKFLPSFSIPRDNRIKNYAINVFQIIKDNKVVLILIRSVNALQLNNISHVI